MQNYILLIGIIKITQLNILIDLNFLLFLTLNPFLFIRVKLEGVNLKKIKLIHLLKVYQTDKL